MVPNTALGILLSGLVLVLDGGGQLSRGKRLLLPLAAGIVSLIGLVTLTQYMLGRDIGMNGLLFPNAVMQFAPARMAIMSAAAFTLLGGAFLLWRHPRGFAVGQYLVLAAGLLCLFNAIGYVYGIRSFYRLAFVAGSTAMAIHASLTFVILCAGALLSRPDWGLMSTITSPSPGGVMARRLLPAALLTPVAVGWVQWQGQERGLYDAPFGLALFTAASIVIFTFLIWRSGQELNRLDAERARAEGNMRQLADSMPQMVWAATPEGNLDYYNQRWYEYTGMNFEMTKDWGWKPVLHPDDLENTMQVWTGALRSSQSFEMEYRVRRASDGVYRWHLGQARPIRNSEGDVERWFGTCTDVEDYKHAEAEIRILNENLEERVRDRTAQLEQAGRRLAQANEELNSSSLKLEQSNRELQDFAAVASHDLQEPLRKVQAFGERLKTVCGEALDAQGRDYLDRMLNASQRMQTLIQDLLRFARVTSQAHPFSPVDLAQVAREVLSDLEVRISETNARVEVGYLPSIQADAMQMRQLLQNLIGNALKFRQIGTPPVIRVYAEEASVQPDADGMFRLVVQDNGIGFEEKYLDRIFTVFQRLHGRAEYEGTGVGLAICRKIAQRHGGEITATSSPGQGACFRVALPLAGTGAPARFPGAGAQISLSNLNAAVGLNSSRAADTEYL